jgi:hypothetical protein
VHTPESHVKILQSASLNEHDNKIIGNKICRSSEALHVIPCTKVYFAILFLLGTFKVQPEQHKPVPLEISDFRYHRKSYRIFAGDKQIKRNAFISWDACNNGMNCVSK